MTEYLTGSERLNVLIPTFSSFLKATEMLVYCQADARTIGPSGMLAHL